MLIQWPNERQPSLSMNITEEKETTGIHRSLWTLDLYSFVSAQRQAGVLMYLI